LRKKRAGKKLATQRRLTALTLYQEELGAALARDVTSPATGGPIKPFRMDYRLHTPNCRPRSS